MNSQTGLDYIIENKEFTQKLATALDTTNTVVKKQVIELLSALCVYSSEGYERALSALEHYKDQKRLPNRFKLITTELQTSEDAGYKTALLAFCNCVIISTEKVEDRVRIRNEFVGQKLLDIIADLRKEAEKLGEQDLSVQLDVFDEQQASDVEQLPLSTTEGLDLSSHLDIFTAILKQIGNSEAESSFLSILQHLLQAADPKESNSILKWQTIEKLVYSSLLLENKDEAEKLFHSGQKRLAKAIHGEEIDNKTSRTVDLPDTSAEPNAPPPPPPPPGVAPPPPPGAPPPPPFGAPAPPPPPGAPPLPPGAPPPPGMKPPEPKKLPQQVIPTPKAKTRKLQWAKIPTTKVVGKKTIWSTFGNTNNQQMVDFSNIEQLFLVEDPTKASKHTDGTQTMKRKKESLEVSLLDNRASLKVNIFLRQFRLTNSEIIKLLEEGRSSEIGAEKLRGLLKLLPQPEEIELIKGYGGDKDKLANAEQFYLQLLELPFYKLRIEIMLLREEFANTIGYISECVDTVIVTAQDMMDSKDLQELLYLVLVTGNFLNSGAYAGDAAGIKITSLLKLSELRSNKPRMNLLHVVVMQAEKYKPSLLQMADAMKYLKNTAEVNVDALTSDITQLADKVKSLTSQLETASPDLQKHFSTFLTSAGKEVALVGADIKEIEVIRTELAEYFAEDLKTFKFEECFTIMRTFCERFKKAIVENKQRELVEKKQIQRQRQKQEQQAAHGNTVARRRIDQIGTTPADRNSSTSLSSEGDDESHIVDNILGDIRSGFIQKKSFGDTAFTVTKVKKVNLQGTDPVTSPKAEPETASSKEEKKTAEALPQFKFLEKSSPTSPEQNNNIPEVHKSLDIPNKRVRPSPNSKTATNNSEALFDFLVKAEETEDDKPFERKKSLRRRRVRPEVIEETEQKSRDASPAARSSDNEADVSGESASNSLERPSSRPVSLNNLHGLQEAVLPGQPDNLAEKEVKVIVPTKYQASSDTISKSPFSRSDKTRASLKDQMAERYNGKKHDVASVLQKLQASAAGKKEEVEKKKTGKDTAATKIRKSKDGKIVSKATESEPKSSSKVLQRVNSISSEASHEGEVAAGLLHSLRAKREEEEKDGRPLLKRSDSTKVGNRISNKFKNLYSTDDEDNNGMFYQPPNRKTKSPQEISHEDATCIDSGVEMNGDTASNRTSYSSTIDTIDLKAISTSTTDMTDSTLKDLNTSSSETIAEKPKKKVSTSTKKPSTSTKKKTAVDKTTPTKTTTTRTRTSAGMARSGSDKSPRTTSSKTAANGVFDRLSGGSTKSRPVSASSRAASRESVMSLDSTISTSTATDSKSIQPKRSSLNSRPHTTKTNASPADKSTHKKVVRKTTDAAPSGVSVRRSTSSVARTATTSVAGVMRPKGQRSSLNNKPSVPPAEGGSIEDRATFLKKMLGNKTSAMKAS